MERYKVEIAKLAISFWAASFWSQRRDTVKWKPVEDFKVNSKDGMGSGRVDGNATLNRRRIDDSTTFTSAMANFWPATQPFAFKFNWQRRKRKRVSAGHTDAIPRPSAERHESVRVATDGILQSEAFRIEHEWIRVDARVPVHGVCWDIKTQVTNRNRVATCLWEIFLVVLQLLQFLSF